MIRTLTLGYSPCPNDTFIFHALVHGLVPTPGFAVRERLEDVETLNRLALAGSLDLTTMNILEKLFVLLVVGATPGDGRHYGFIRDWSAGLADVLRR